MNNSLLTLLLIALGGLTGALARYGLSGLVQGDRINFPFGTLVVNLIGCFIMGLMVYFIRQSLLHSELRSLLGYGFLGAFTTFSAFSAETLNLVIEGNYSTALLYICASMLGSLAAVTLGYLLAKACW